MGWKYFIESTAVFFESLYFYRHRKCHSLPGISEKNHINHFAHLTRCADHNTDLPSSSNISKTVRVNIVFTEIFCKEYSISFLMIARLIDLWLSRYRRLKFAGLFESQKSRFFNFSGTDPADNHTFKVNNKDPRTKPLVSLPTITSASVVNFEQVNAGWRKSLSKVLENWIW